MNEKYIVTICGSYRRGKKESGDIDVLLTHPTYTSKEKESKKRISLLKDIVECLERKKLIVDTISLGSTKFMVTYFTIYQLNLTKGIMFKNVFNLILGCLSSTH